MKVDWKTAKKVAEMFAQDEKLEAEITISDDLSSEAIVTRLEIRECREAEIELTQKDMNYGCR